MAERLRICLAGQLRLEVDGAAADASSLGPLGTVALAFFVMQRDRPVTKDELAEVLWGEDLPATWEPSLRALISRIRKRLGEAGVVGAGDVIVGGRGSYQLRLPPGVSVDVEEASVAVESARRLVADGEAPEAARLAAGAVDVAGLPFLGGTGGLWAERRQVELAALRVDGLEVLSDALSACGDHSGAVAAADAAVAAEPLRESAHLRAVATRAAAGNRAEALRAYERCRRVLAEELGLSPSPRLETAYLALLEDTVVPVAEPGAFRTNLGAELSSFVGRADQVLAVQKLLGLNRLVTLVGPGGVGKTRLAARVAAGLVDMHRDGVWLVELAPLVDPTLLSQHVVSAVELSDMGRLPPTESLSDHLADRQLLLVLDNCEHIVTACAALVRELLAACPGLVVLATSRAPLGVTGEAQWPVPTLSVPDPGIESSADGLCESEAVRLFVERASAADPGFTITHDNAAPVADICRRLDGLPLAIELAAARARSLSVQDIALRLRDRFRLLVGTDPTAPDRHRTLRAAVDWSHDFLGPTEQALFRRVSVFSGSFGLDAAEEVCGDGGVDVLDGLAALVAKSLVVADRSGPSTRYRLLETLRQYGAERLVASGEQAVVRARYLAWVCALAEHAEPELEGGDQPVWLRRLDAEEDNVRAALDWAVSHPAGDEGLRAAGALWRYWQVRGRFDEGLRWLRALLEADPEVQPAVRAKALGSGAVLLLTRSTTRLSDEEAETARTWLEESLALRRRIGDQRGAASTLHGLGGIYLRRGDVERARACFEETLGIGRELGEKRLVAASLVNLVSCGSSSPDSWVEGRALLEEALALWRELGDHYATARALTDLSTMASRDCDYESARALLVEATEIQRALGDQRGLALSTAGLGEVARLAADPDEARARLEESLAMDRELRSPAPEARELSRLGYLAWTLGDVAEARRRYTEAAAVARPLEVKWQLRNALGNLGLLALEEGDVGRARRMFDEAEAVAEEAEDLTPGSPWNFIVRALLALVEADPPEAAAQCRQALDIYARSPHRPSETFALILDVLAVLSAPGGEPERSSQLVGAADTSRQGCFMPFRSRPEFEGAQAAAVSFPADYAEGAGLGLDAAISLARSALDALPRDQARRRSEARPPS